MALGRPLVVTSGHGYDEFIRPDVDALAVAPGDAQALGNAIATLVQDPDRREALGCSAAERARDYDVPLVARAFVERLQTLL
jgi:glycosyltransferase involved in cell wall biosynthesis